MSRALFTYSDGLGTIMALLFYKTKLFLYKL